MSLATSSLPAGVHSLRQLFPRFHSIGALLRLVTSFLVGSTAFSTTKSTLTPPFPLMSCRLACFLTLYFPQVSFYFPKLNPELLPNYHQPTTYSQWCRSTPRQYTSLQFIRIISPSLVACYWLHKQKHISYCVTGFSFALEKCCSNSFHLPVQRSPSCIFLNLNF